MHLAVFATADSGHSARVLPGLLALAASALLAPAVTTAASVRAYDFDKGHEPLAGAEEYAPWADLMARHRGDLSVLQACLSDAKACPHYLRGYQRIVHRARDLDARGQLDVVNRFINRRRWSRDRDADGKRNQTFATLHDFLRGGGDCEDFALAKYFMLRELGFSPEALRVVVSWDRKERAYHAVVAAYVEDRVWLLETDDTIRRRWQQRDYRYVYAINEESIWDHAGPGVTRPR